MTQFPSRVDMLVQTLRLLATMSQ